MNSTTPVPQVKNGRGKPAVVLALTDDPQSSEKPRWHRAPDLVDAIMAHAHEAPIPLTLGGEQLIQCRAGGIVVVMGPTGAMKTSLVVAFALEHARERGPVVVLSRELTSDEFGARGIGMQCDASWLDVLTGKVPRSEMERALALPRMVVLDRQDATLDRLREAIQAARAEYPGEPIMAVIDYVQIIESGERDARAKVAEVVSQIDDIARAPGRALMIAISQMSRASSRAAGNGEALGAASTDGGAESAAIERAASVTLCIGSAGPDREDGTRAVDISIGKSRMGGGDRVWKMSANGRTGRWRIDGDSRPASEVKAERDSSQRSARQQATELAMAEVLRRSKEPMTREDLIRQAHAEKTAGRSAIAAMVGRREIVEVRRKAKRSPVWQIWTRTQAEAAGIEIVEGI